MRLFYAALALEANTFLPIPTSYQAFVEKIYYPPGKHPEKSGHQTGAIGGGARARAKRDGFELIEGSCFAASPAGTTIRAAYERMRDEIIGQLKAALPVDGAVFGLHGAMVADGYDDCEGDFIARVRALVGPRTVIGVELDPHCHLTVKRYAAADIIVLYKEFPHTDFAERGEDVLDLVLRTLRGEINPVKSLFDCRQIQAFRLDPADAGSRRQHHRDRRQGRHPLDLDRPLLSLWRCRQLGGRILVVTDKARPHGDELAKDRPRIGRAARQAAPPEYSVDGGIDLALAFTTSRW